MSITTCSGSTYVKQRDRSQRRSTRSYPKTSWSEVWIAPSKYEMLRQVRVEGVSVAAAARAFGFSRVAFYQMKAAFQKEGLPGLLPRRRGPKAANKLTAAVLEFIDRHRAADSSLRATQLAALLRRRLHLKVHPRSIERALARREKKGRPSEPT